MEGSVTVYVDAKGEEISPLEAARQVIDPVELVRELIEIGHSGGKGDQPRVSAINSLLDRVWPRPAPDKQAQTNIQVNFNSPVSAMTTAQLEQLLSKLTSGAELIECA